MEEKGGKGVCVCVVTLGCGMKFRAVEGSHTAERPDRGPHRSASHTSKHTEGWPKRKEEEKKEKEGSAGMAMYEPAYLPPNAEEQDFIQAYENVREKYKGGRVRSCYRNNSIRTSLSDRQACVFVFVSVPFICLTQHRWDACAGCRACFWSGSPACSISWLLSVFYWLPRMLAVTFPHYLCCVFVCIARVQWIYRSASLSANKQSALLTSDLDVIMRLYFKVSALCPLQPASSTTEGINRCC